MRWAVIGLAVLAVACGGKVNRLSSVEQTHYTALKVWMERHEEKAFLKNKTEEERNQWLKDHGYWDRFYQYDQTRRNQIAEGDVQVGWSYDQVLMAWGHPWDKKRLTGRPYSRSELYVYRLEVDDDGSTRVYVPGSRTAHTAAKLYQVELFIDDNVVTELLEKDGWE